MNPSKAGNLLAQNTIRLTPVIVVNASISNEFDEIVNKSEDVAEAKLSSFRPISRSQSLRSRSKSRNEKLDKTFSDTSASFSRMVSKNSKNDSRNGSK